LNDVEPEKRWFTTKWARQEKEIRKIIESTQGTYGDLQAVTGRSLPTIAALELPEAIGCTGTGETVRGVCTRLGLTEQSQRSRATSSARHWSRHAI